jgi:hypothetical protein
MRHKHATTVMVVTAVVAAVMAGCGGADVGPAVATVSCGVSRTRVPLGAPLDLTFRFQVAADAVIDGDYRVMVHFVDVDDELMWTDDHDPPTPTSLWRSGQTIEYTRTHFLPVYPYLGTAVVEVGLYDASTGRRLKLGGDDRGQRAYAVATIDMLPESEGVFLVYGDGWHVPEVSSSDALEEWRWTDQEARISFRNPKRDIVVRMQLDGRPDLFDGAQQVSLRIGEQVVDTFALDVAERVLHTVRVAGSALGDGDIVEMIIAPQTFIPSEAGAADTRRLGVRIFHLYVE